MVIEHGRRGNAVLCRRGRHDGVAGVVHVLDVSRIISQAVYDLTSSQAVISVMGTPSAVTNAYGFLTLGPAGTTYLEWIILGGTLTANYYISGTKTTLVNLTYSPVTHAWWRIRESGGTSYWDTSPDGLSWVNQASVADPFTETQLFADIGAGCYENETNPGSFVVSDFNVTPAIAPAAALPGPSWRRAFQPWRRAAQQRVQPAPVISCTGSATLAPMAVSGSATVIAVAASPAARPAGPVVAAGVPAMAAGSGDPDPAAGRHYGYGVRRARPDGGGRDGCRDGCGAAASIPGPAWRLRYQPWRRAAQLRSQPPAVITATGSVALAAMAVSGTVSTSSELPPAAALPGPSWRRMYQPWRRAAQERVQPPGVITASGSAALAPLAAAGTITGSPELAPAAALPGPSWTRAFQPWRRAAQLESSRPPPSRRPARLPWRPWACRAALPAHPNSLLLPRFPARRGGTPSSPGARGRTKGPASCCHHLHWFRGTGADGGVRERHGSQPGGAASCRAARILMAARVPALAESGG